MLFSQPEVAAFMNERFECAWESLRDAPRSRIDFGDGHVLDRTLGGNVLTWICLPDGRAVDVVPGVMNAETWREQLDAALRAFASVRSDPDPVERARHLALSNADSWARYVPAVWEEADLSELPSNLFSVPSVSGLATSFVSKSIVEDPVLDASGIAHGQGVGRRDPLEEDSVNVVTRLKPQASAILMRRPLSRPDELTGVLFRTVMEVDLADPFLGFAVGGHGGELGRYGPRGPEGPAPRDG